MSDTDGVTFELDVEWAWGQHDTVEFGPIPEEELDEYGNPPEEDITTALWRMVDDKITWRRVDND